MPLSVALTHHTAYHYDRAVWLGPQTIRLRPAPHARTPVPSYALHVEPRPHFINWQQDPQGNHLARVVFPERVVHFDVTVDLVADMATVNPFDFFVEPDAESWPFSYDPLLEQELVPFRRLLPVGPRLRELLDQVPRGEQPTVEMLVMLNRMVRSRVRYIARMEPGVWVPEQTLTAGEGSCRDSAWLLVQVLRQFGYAARFVSGYLIQLVTDVEPLEGAQGPTVDFADLHAWAEAYVPGAGWVGMDATSGLLTGEGHIPLAATPAPQSAAPITGLVEPCETEFSFDVHVTRVRETPRATKPYSEAQWQHILATGAAVDRSLAAGDVRLTMGGRPTFVHAKDIDAPEWNTDALGPTKQRLGWRLLRRLRERWAPGAVLQNVSGKHYPGEQLPRWALYAHWRKDGEPIWRDMALLANEADTDDANAADATRFCAALAERLRIDPSLINAAYEDIHYYLWREHRLPTNVLTDDAKLTDPLERARLARILGRHLGTPVGAVLPLCRAIRNDVRVWQSARWHFRSEALLLLPGDSPIGYRLPLDSLPWVDPTASGNETEADPFAPQVPLPMQQALRGALAPTGFMGGSAEGFRPVPEEPPVVGSGDADLVRTALCVEPRGGVIHVFFPPLYAAQDWLTLASAVEDTAEELGRKVVLEGYQPPRDPGLVNFSVTPSPGVIEVNVHPAVSWAEIVQRGAELYEAAREVGLATEKFMLDGRHVGTGGGNHVVMGAAEPADSPFLRRPDLLKSLLGFWHNHPSLSYLFSGLFIGPSSQHPRIDEARQDSLAELEIAFSQIRPGEEVAPWLVDRMFRHLLADMTGNTHRTEFCIDRLYAPETASGRLGLVEFRALEMPPDARMAAAQLLLMRAAIAAFWQTPYERRLVRWGTRIHDDFLLPHFVAQDFANVLEELGEHGYCIEFDWFVPHFEFRFPRIGEVTLRGTKIELRHALEPWHVLGEERASGAAVRLADTSVERVQALVSGWVDERYVLACNGRAVPLTATERAGEYVGAVRFKAWQPPLGALHPTIPVQTPLVFDVYDRWSGRSLGGLTHHVSHPGGRSYERSPVNANEAEARRRARFCPFGHTPGPMPEPRLTLSHEHPRTLDLRRGG